MPVSDEIRRSMAAKLELLYGDQAAGVLTQIDALADRYAPLREQRGKHAGQPLWDERSVVLITYGDQVRQSGRPSLEVLNQFLHDFDLPSVLSGIHILPFFPYSSDDGFSVIDYRHVDPPLGNWTHVEELNGSFDLMFDFVVNHCSQRNEWFQCYLRGESPYSDYFIDVAPATDLSTVTRPRSSPLLTPFDTARGTRHLWTTFSADQIDLNFAHPGLLIEMLDTLLFYVQRGARIVRLDAIGFLWKRIGTTCMHLPETHAVVQLMRELLDEMAPGTILITETNVPHEENVSYFGDGNEAHAVYQFSLAPLLLDAYLTGDAGPLNEWLSALEYPGPGRTFFNFTASHDGIGVRPLEGLVSRSRCDGLVEAVRQRGGLVSMRQKPDGSQSPYELNITYLSALDSSEGLPAEVHAQKFLASQALMVALRGMPGIYFHSLVGTPNDHAGVEQSGHHRSINRRKFDIDELRSMLNQENSTQALVFRGYRHMLATRIGQPAFHPDADQTVVPTGHSSLIGFTRGDRSGDRLILVLGNVGAEPVQVDVARLIDAPLERDLMTGRPVRDGTFDVGPFDTAWLA